MMLVKEKFSYYYDRQFDDLTVRIDNTDEAFADEIYNDIYLFKDSVSEKVVAFQILYFMNRSDKILKKYLPENYYEIVMEIKEELTN